MSRPRPAPVLFVALLVPLLAFAWPLLWLWGNPALLYGQEADADRLYAAAPAALLGPQKVSGPADKLAGRYLSRAGGLHRWLGRHGFRLTNQMGAACFYNNGADLSAQTVCRRFSRGFEACSLRLEGGEPK